MSKGYPSLEIAQKLWQEGMDYRSATTDFVFRNEYIFHTRGVAESAKIIAAHTSDMDSEKAYILGLLHDYGKKYDECICGKFHGQVGFEEMNAKGYPAVAKICLTHSFPRQNFVDADYSSYRPEWRTWAHNELAKVSYDDYDRLIQLCDMFFEGMTKVDVETRFSCIINRYHLDPKVVEVLRADTNRNKEYFEQKTGYNIYELLDIKTV